MTTKQGNPGRHQHSRATEEPKAKGRKLGLKRGLTTLDNENMYSPPIHNTVGCTEKVGAWSNSTVCSNTVSVGHCFPPGLWLCSGALYYLSVSRPHTEMKTRKLSQAAVVPSACIPPDFDLFFLYSFKLSAENTDTQN